MPIVFALKSAGDELKQKKSLSERRILKSKYFFCLLFFNFLMLFLDNAQAASFPQSWLLKAAIFAVQSRHHYSDGATFISTMKNTLKLSASLVCHLQQWSTFFPTWSRHYFSLAHFFRLPLVDSKWQEQT